MYLPVQEMAELMSIVPFIINPNDEFSEDAKLTLSSVEESYSYSKMNSDHRGNIRTLGQKKQNFIDKGILPEAGLVRGFSSLGIPAIVNPVARSLRKHHRDHAWDIRLFNGEASLFLELKHQNSLYEAVFTNWTTQSCFKFPVADYYLMWVGDVEKPSTVRTHAVLSRKLFENPSYWKATNIEGGLAFNYTLSEHRSLGCLVKRHSEKSGLVAY